MVLDLAIQDGGSMGSVFDGVDGGGGGLGRGSQELWTGVAVSKFILVCSARTEVRSSTFDNHSTTSMITMPYLILLTLSWLLSENAALNS